MAPLNSNSALSSDSDCSDSESSPETSRDGESTDTDTELKLIYSSKPSLRNARDLALMAEERWIIEVLKSIRQQRNALKVEALYYQGLKAQLYGQHAKEFGENSAGPPDNHVDLPIPEPVFPELSPTIDQCFAPNGPLTSEHEAVLRMKQMDGKQKDPSNVEDFALLEGQCNLQELQNLTVEKEKRLDTWDIEDPEYESEEEEEWSRVNIDMSMLVGHNDGDI